MFGFIAWIFWLAVFAFGIFFMGAILMYGDLDQRDDMKDNESSDTEPMTFYFDDLNDWGRAIGYLVALLAAVLASWRMGFLYLFLGIFSLFTVYFIYKLLLHFGVEFNDNGRESVKKFHEEVTANGFPKKYAPITTVVFASIFIGLIGLSGLDTNSSSSSSASKSYISEVAEGYSVSEAKAREWIDLIGLDEFKDANSDRNLACMWTPDSDSCMALGTMDEEVRKRAGKAGCKEDWQKCTTKKEFEDAHFYWWLDIGSACIEAANKSQGRNAMKAYGGNPFSRYKITESLGRDGKVILYSTDMEYECSYDLNKKAAKITDSP